MNWEVPVGEMRVDDALHEIVHTTHAMFGVDSAGLMLPDAETPLRQRRYPTVSWRAGRACDPRAAAGRVQRDRGVRVRPSAPVVSNASNAAGSSRSSVGRFSPPASGVPPDSVFLFDF